MKVLRDYQVENASNGVNILKDKKIVYLCMSVRTGKTATSMEIARLYGANKVLFLTKKIAMNSIKSDYDEFGYAKYFSIEVMNDESMHKLNGDYDLVIHDEHHRFGAVPKPGKATKTFKKMFGHLPMIFLSGTPTPEGYSQIYHQYWVSAYSPFAKYRNFYAWAKEFVIPEVKYTSHGPAACYKNAYIDKIEPITNPYVITYTQEQAGFESVIEEECLYVDMKPSTYSMCDRLIKDLIIQGKDEVILADTSVKLQQKLHQMYSGTVKFESGNAMVIDYSKAEFIRDRFKGVKIGIFYKFIAELEALRQVFGVENLTNDLDEFNSTDKSIALQIISGREGISLQNAEFLVFYNIDFSATSYWQGRDRMTTMDRKFNKIYWIFSAKGIERKIYKSVMNKKSYTLSHFKEDYGKIP
jgi:hypothetical protein